MHRHVDTENRGREATEPWQIPVRGWKDILRRIRNGINNDHIQIIAAGIAFYFFIGLFPLIAAALSIYGLVIEPSEVERQVVELARILPDQSREVISEMLHAIAEKSDNTLGWSLVFNLGISLWGANKAMKVIFEGVNIAYDESECRNFLVRNSLTLLFTMGAIVLGFVCIGMVVGFPAFIDNLNLPPLLNLVLELVRWVLLGLLFVFALSIVYTIAPCRNNPKFKWTTWGATTATILWLSGSLLFSYYVENFSNYDKTYGGFAAIIILLLWLYLTGYIILLGAEINAEMEHQTRRDTTVGEEKPLGYRNAWHADHVAGEN